MEDEEEDSNKAVHELDAKEPLEKAESLGPVLTQRKKPKEVHKIYVGKIMNEQYESLWTFFFSSNISSMAASNACLQFQRIQDKSKLYSTRCPK